MANPKYKFFRDELEAFEIPYYSNGEEIKFQPSTDELKAGAERIIEELKRRGYRQCVNADRSRVTFSKPEYCKAAYVGTTVNPFSFNEKVWWWSNNFAVSKKFITLSEVYRGNGTNQNATLRICVGVCNSDKEPKWMKSTWHDGGKTNKYGVEIPFEYEYISVGGNFYRPEEIRKFKPSISDKVLKNIIDKAEEVLGGYEVFDPSCWEADAKDFPAATTKEYLEYKHIKDTAEN